MIYSLYRWELEALKRGAILRSIDQRRENLELAVYIGNVVLSKKPKQSINKANRDIDKQEKDVYSKKPLKRTNKDKLVQLNTLLNNSFGGGANG